MHRPDGSGRVKRQDLKRRSRAQRSPFHPAVIRAVQGCEVQNPGIVRPCHGWDLQFTLRGSETRPCGIGWMIGLAFLFPLREQPRAQ
jgi:hypothetical protein